MPKTKLTSDRVVATLKAKSGVPFTEYVDPAHRGLLLRVSRHGLKRWYYRYRNGAQRHFVPIGNYPGVSCAEALNAYTSYCNSAIDLWTEYQVVEQDGQKRLTFAQMTDRYVRNYAKVYKRSWSTDQALLNRNVLGRVAGFSVPLLARKPADDITRQDLLRIVSRVSERGAWAEARKTAAVLSILFRWGEKNGLISDASIASRLTPKPPESVTRARQAKTDRVLTDSEVAAVWKALREHSEAWAGVCAMILLTGQRPGEVCTMEWRHIKDQIWTIPMTKNGRPHTVPLPDLVITFLDSLPHHRRVVFPAIQKQGPVDTDHVARKLGALLAELNIKHFTPYKLRGYVSTGMEQLGIPYRHIAEVLNHTLADVTSQRFAKRDYFNEKHQALDRWCTYLDRVVNKRTAVVVPIR